MSNWLYFGDLVGGEQIFLVLRLPIQEVDRTIPLRPTLSCRALS